MNAVDATYRTDVSRGWRPAFGAVLVIAVLAALLFAFLSAADPAYAGRASTGELAFYPCTKCHPVTLGADGKPTKPLPSGFTQHEIKLEVHDILGKGDKACLACHDDPAKNPGKLILPDGSFVDVNGDVSRVCQRCHFEKYQQFKVGVHGKNEKSCTAAGCHDPHTPSWIYVQALPPFQGTGMEVNAVGEDRGPFKPLAGPPVQPPVYTPVWLQVLASLGFVAALGIVGFLVVGRAKQ